MAGVAAYLSVVIPCFNEVGSLRELYQRVHAELAALPGESEIIFIDDGSNDGSVELLRELATEDPSCRVIYFRRNCGKAAALQVGFRAATGKFIITMDADLQDDPKEIPRFLTALETYDVVSGWKATRHDPLEKRLPSRLFNATVRHFTGVQLHDMNCGFKGYRRAVLQEVNLYGELHRYIPALAAARGFSIGELAVTHHARTTGVSKYGLERYLRGLFDLMTVVYITKYRFRPLHLFGSIGLGLLALGLLMLFCLSLPVIFERAPLWQYTFWWLASGMCVIGTLSIGLGLLAEGQLAGGFHAQPLPPVAEVLNLQENEARHDG